MTATDDLPAGLLRYLGQRATERQAHIAAVLTGLTDRERQLVREAAVRGFVRGTIYGRIAGQPDVPPDSAVVAEVVDGCRTFPDLYPLLGGRQ